MSHPVDDIISVNLLNFQKLANICLRAREMSAIFQSKLAAMEDFKMVPQSRCVLADNRSTIENFTKKLCELENDIASVYGHSESHFLYQRRHLQMVVMSLRSFQTELHNVTDTKENELDAHLDSLQGSTSRKSVNKPNKVSTSCKRLRNISYKYMNFNS